MKKIIFFPLIVFSILLFTASCATQKNIKVSSKADTSVKPVEKVRIPEIFGTRQIKDWQAIDNKTIIINTYSYGKYKATFTMTCNGIPFTETIGFLTQGPYALDAHTTIVLSNGERCNIKELIPYNEEDEEEGN
jgi:hypothetical protein